MNAFPIYEPLQRRKKRFIQRNGKTDYFVLVKEVKEYVMSGSLSLLQESDKDDPRLSSFIREEKIHKDGKAFLLEYNRQAQVLTKKMRL
jgi:hypothetical protein